MAILGKPDEKIYSFLSEKYAGPFTFLSAGDASLFSAYKAWLFADEAGRRFTVREERRLVTDNYCSQLYDGEAARLLREAAEGQCRFVVDSSDVYLGAVPTGDCLTYLRACPFVHAELYLPQSFSEEKAAEAMRKALPGVNFSAVLYVVERPLFRAFSAKPEPETIAAAHGFRIRADRIRWEEK